MAFQLPELPSLPGIQNLDLNKLNPTKCGSSEALEALDGLRDGIKDVLAQGKSALGELAALKEEAAGAMEEALTEITAGVEGAAKSFQEEIAELQTKIGEEFAAAKLAIESEWGGVVDDINGVLDKVPSLTDLLSGAAAVDLCKEVQNVEKVTKKVWDDNLGEYVEVEEIVVKAPKIVVADISSSLPEPLTPTVVNKTEQPSAGVRSDLSRNEALIQWGEKVYFVVKETIGDYFNPLNEAWNKRMNELRNNPEIKSIFAKIKETGKKAKELQAEGLLTEAEIQARTEYNVHVRAGKDLQSRKNMMDNMAIYHRGLIVGINTQETFDKYEEVYKTTTVEGGEALLTVDDQPTYNRVLALQTSRSDLIKAYNEYTGKV